MDKEITIVGLGPGGMKTLTIGTLEKLKNACNLWLRTGKHPVVNDLKEQGIQFDTFDYLYEQMSEFSQVYVEIAQCIIKEVKKGPVIYAVPGHPMVGEESVQNIVKLAKQENISFEILPAMSFIDPTMAILGMDLSAGLKIIDGLSLIENEAGLLIQPDPQIANLIMQVYSPMVASDIKLTMMKYYSDEHIIKVVRAAGLPGEERIEEIPLFELDRLSWIDHLTCVYVPPFIGSKSCVSRFPLDEMVDMLDKLRDENGCPWDREQTHITLKKYLIEETHEVLDAIDEGNMYKVCEELGDLLLQIIFHAQIARESGFFDINNVIKVISEKIIRRHPHVFGNLSVKTSDEVSVNWEAIKKKELEEKGENRKSLLDGVPHSMPGLYKADKIQRKAAKVGFDWPDYTGALEKVDEELNEIKEVINAGDKNRLKDEIGDLLFAVVNLSRLLNLDAEESLQSTVSKFKERFVYMEKLAVESGLEIGKMSLTDLDKLWDEAKKWLNDNNL
jgi:tetrapyrrole methylase family protein/MazG family protein